MVKYGRFPRIWRRLVVIEGRKKLNLSELAVNSVKFGAWYRNYFIQLASLGQNFSLVRTLIMVVRKIWVPKQELKEPFVKQDKYYSHYQRGGGSASSSSFAVQYHNSGLHSQKVREERRGNVPKWEKNFCYSESKITWKRICDAKKMLPDHKKVAEWDDSACKEAFFNSKYRYWAKINNLPCDIPLPDPDMYLDKLDWDTQIDSNLLIDFDKAKVYVESLTDSPPSLKECLNPLAITGWGDEDPPKTTGFRDVVPLATIGWGDEVPLAITCWGDEVPHATNGWGDEVPHATNGWGDEVSPAATRWGDEVPLAAIGLGQEYTPAATGWRRGCGRINWRMNSTRGKKADVPGQGHRDNYYHPINTKL
ncbi:hypothetical protein ZOSMA_57G00540 [Zostera marina]|uniref:Uncharacterized protein n=1 Tax=Zostera marina TaxID=29655 RepID=A0A0K9NVR2_ZOSMR|nr:hypothetical protein ZOSMA_57G00540 [Zostera marina]